MGIVKYRYPEVSTTNPLEQKNAIEALLNTLVYGGKCLGHSTITITGAVAKSFADALNDGGGADAIPAGAKAALCVLEADNAEVNGTRVCRFKQDGNDPTNASGMPVGDNGTFEIDGTDNLDDFKIIGITAANTHTLRITWFGAS